MESSARSPASDRIITSGGCACVGEADEEGAREAGGDDSANRTRVVCSVDRTRGWESEGKSSSTRILCLRFEIGGPESDSDFEEEVALDRDSDE